MSSNHFISSDKTLLNVELIHDYLSNRSYWAKGRTLDEVKTTIANSICFGIYINSEQVGFCRVVSDKVAFAYIMDFFVLESQRGNGLSKKLLLNVLEHPDLQTVHWYLATKDAHGLYSKFGFKQLPDPLRFMKKERAGDS